MATKKLFFVLCLAFLGCVETRPAATGESLSPVLQAAPVDPNSGNLIALWMPIRGPGGKGTQLEPVLVTSRYATFIYWPNPEYTVDAAEKRMFIFYDNVQKKCWQTRDYAAYLDVVVQQPRDIEVIQIETCTVARCYMPSAEWTRLEATMAARKIRWAIDPVTGGPMRFCYCEATGEFVYPADKQ